MSRAVVITVPRLPWLEEEAEAYWRHGPGRATSQRTQSESSGRTGALNETSRGNSWRYGVSVHVNLPVTNRGRRVPASPRYLAWNLP